MQQSAARRLAASYEIQPTNEGDAEPAAGKSISKTNSAPAGRSIQLSGQQRAVPSRAGHEQDRSADGAEGLDGVELLDNDSSLLMGDGAVIF